MAHAWRHDGRAIVAALALALCLSVVVAWPASANLGGVFPTDEDGGTAIEAIASDQNLFAYALTDIQGGDICIVPAAMEDPGNGSLNCLSPAWGTSNRVMGVGSTWTLIETPYLRAGHWKLLGDGGSKESVDVFSNDFTVLPCEPGACDPRLAQLTAQRYKNAAAAMAASMRGIGWTLKVLEEVSPQEPFEHVNVINKVLRSKLEDDVLFKRVIADKTTRKLQFATRIPAGPHAMALAIGHQVSADALEMYLDIVNDPPAPYDTVAQPQFDVPAASTGDAGLDGLMLDVAQLTGYGAAGRKAFERYQQAATDDSAVGVHRQAGAMGRFTAQLASEMRSAALGLDRWASLLEADPTWAGATVDQEQLDALQSIGERVRSTGFDADERAGFAAADLSEETIDALEEEIGTDGYDAVQVDVPVEQLLRDAAAELREQAPAFDAVASEADAVAQTTNAPPVASFTATPESGEPPLAVSFRDTSTHADDEPLTISWDFGDGTTAEGAEVSHTFAAGTHTVTQTVSDGVSSSTATRTITATPPPGTPVARPDQLGTVRDTPRTIDVLANDSDPQGGALTLVDASTPEHGTAACTPQGACTYTPDAGFTGPDAFTYVVEDANGERATGQVTVTVNASNQPPVADAGPDLEALEDAGLVLDGSGSSDPDGPIVDWVWDFGDGSEPQTNQTPTISYAYGRNGTYTVRLTVKDAHGATAEDTATLTVANRAPTVTVDPLPRAPIGRTRPYGASIGTGSKEPTTVAVDFGDGATAEGEITGSGRPEFDHAYAEAGVYTVAFTATDSAGETATAQQTVRVEDAVADAGPDVSTDEGTPLTLGGASSPSDPYTTVQWDFGDGTQETGAEVEHTYRDEGVYTATVTVEDDTGKVSDAVRVTVRNAAPVPGLAAAGSAAPGQLVSMRGWARDPGPDDVLTYTWTFGDGATATGRRASHAYAAPGSYTARLRVADADGASATAERTIVVGGPSGRRDNRGKDFWLSFPSNAGEPTLTLFVAAEAATLGRVEIPGLGWSDTFTVTPGEATAVALPSAAQLDRAVADPQDLGIHVSAASEVSVYGLNRIKFTTDAFLGLPTDALGTEYRVISYSPTGTGPEASVVATADGTTLTITPSVDVPGHPAGAPFQVRLDMGEAYQLISELDLTGTRIAADKPVAAFGAHQCAFVPKTVPFCDHLVEQLTPVDTWGRRFATMPLATRTGGDTFRIMAAEPGTTVKVNGTAVATLGAGEHHERLIDGPAVIEATKPVLVAQYSNGSTFDGTTSDPFMTIVPPYEQFQAEYTVATPSEGFEKNFLNLVVPEKAKGDVVLDGQPVPAASFTAIGTSGFVGAQLEVDLGSHRVTSGSPFGVTVYGFDQDDSYGYGGGMALAEVASVTQLRLTPAAETLDTGTDGCVEATGTDAAGAPVPDVRVDFAVVGPNAASGFPSTNAAGVARYCWRGAKVGEDVVTASVGALARTAMKRWRVPNRAPAAADDTAATPEDRALEIAPAALLANDVDPDADPLTVTSVSDASNGTVALAGGKVVFTPDPDHHGPAGFRYAIADGRGGTAGAAVRITVEPVDDPSPTKPPPVEEEQQVKAEAEASDLVLDCTERLVVLEDVVPAGGKVQLVGVADRRFAGQPVSIVFLGTGKVVARPKVGADGSFAAAAPLPPKKLRTSNRARYEARIGAHRSLALKLERRMRITTIGVSGGKLVVTGTVTGPLAARRADRAVELRRRVSCTRDEPVAKAMPRANGTFRIAVDVPAGQSAAVYRLRTKVRHSTASAKPVNTFTLPRGVNF